MHSPDVENNLNLAPRENIPPGPMEPPQDEPVGVPMPEPTPQPPVPVEDPAPTGIPAEAPPHRPDIINPPGQRTFPPPV
jgi:hypothetical protein